MYPEKISFLHFFSMFTMVTCLMLLYYKGNFWKVLLLMLQTCSIVVSVFESGIEKGETHVSPSWKRWDTCIIKLRHMSHLAEKGETCVSSSWDTCLTKLKKWSHHSEKGDWDTIIIIIIKCMCSRCRRDDIHVCFAYASPQRMPHMYDHKTVSLKYIIWIENN